MRAPERPARVRSGEADSEVNLTFDGVDGQIFRISVTHQQVEGLVGGLGEPLGEDAGEEDNVTGHTVIGRRSSIATLGSTHRLRQAAPRRPAAAVQASPG